MELRDGGEEELEISRTNLQPLAQLLAAFPRGGAVPEAGSRSQEVGGGRWDLGPESQPPSPPRLGPAQEMELWGPVQGNRHPSHRPVGGGGGGGELLPEEAGAGLLQSPIKLLVPQGGGWEREDAAHSALQPLHTGLWTAHGHVKTKDTATMEPY